MDIFLYILFLIIGLVLLIKGADFFVDGASAVARKLKVPSLFIGLTIVALGTSLPELSVSIASAIKGNVDLSVGNVVGSNISNMLLIIGIVALLKPIATGDSNKKLDFPFLLVVTGLLLLFCSDSLLDGAQGNIITRTESIILIAVLALYMTLLIINAKKDIKQKAIYDNKPKAVVPDNQPKEEEKEKEKELKIWQIIIYLVLGLGGVMFGAECVSSTAQFLALKMGMSEALVGLTIVALGTSLPELTTSIVAARKGNSDLALGNVLGSNIMNIALILSTVGIIGQIVVSTTILVDVAILFVCTCVFATLSMTNNKINRIEGGVLVFMYVAYLAFAIVRNYCF